MSLLAGGNGSGYRDGIGGDALFDMPLGLALDSNGTLLVADNGNHLIRRIDSNGVVTTVAGGPGGGYQDGSGTNALFSEPSGIAVTSNGIYVADSGNNLIRRIDKNGYVTTVAGWLAGGYNDAKGTNALFLQPSDLVSDKKGTLYVVDTGNNLIRKIDPTGTVSTLAGSQVAGYVDDLGTNALFNSPSAITIDAQGVLSVSDSGNNAIRRIDTNGNVSTLAGGVFPGDRVDGAGTNALFADPTGITVDPSGNLYVAEWGNSDVRRVDPSGVVSTIAAPVYPMQDGTSNNATFNNPSGLAFDALGNLFVADSGNNAIRVIRTNGSVETVTGEGSTYPGYYEGQGTNALFYGPSGIIADALGNLYVCDTGNSLIRQIDSNTSASFLAGYKYGLGGFSNIGFSDGVGADSAFNLPIGITMGADGSLLIADYGNNAIRSIDNSQNVTTIAGATNAGYHDGMGPNALFSGPVGVVIDSTGNLLVSDSLNNVIRRIDTNQNVTTLAGQTNAGYADGQGTNALFSLPTGMGLDAKRANVFIADTGNNLIRRMDSRSNVTTIAGYPLPGYVDGPGSMALFDSPMGIAVATNGVVYVADSANNVIRKITPSSGGFTTNQAILTAYQGTLSNAVILPTNWNGMTVMALAPGALSGQSQVTDLTLPSGITSLPSGIFADCTALTNVSGSAALKNFISSNAGMLGLSNSQTIYFPVPSGLYLGGGSVTLGASASSGLPITYSTPRGGVITLSGSNVATILGVGTTTITASQAGTLYWRPASNTIQIVVTKIPNTIDFPPLANLTYASGLVTNLVATASSGLPVSFSSTNTNLISISSNNLATILGAGTATIVASQAGNSNYLAASPVTQSLVIAPSTNQVPKIGPLLLSSKVYGTAPFTLTAPTSTSSGAWSYSSGNTNVATISGSTVTIKGVGTALITATQAASGNYSGASTNANFVVTAAAPTLGAFTVPGKVYGSAAFGLTAPTSTSSGAWSYSSGNTNVATVSSNTVTIKGVGTAVITATQAASGNYNAASTSANLVVSKAAPTLGAFTVSGKAYGSAAFALTAPTSTSSGAWSYSSGNTNVATVSGSTVTIKGVGTAVITATQAGTGNYNAASTSANLVVSKAAPTLGAFTIPGKVYGSAAFALTAPTSTSSGAWSYSSGNTNVATVSGSTVTIKGVGTAVITATQAASGNYSGASTNVNFVVTGAAPNLGAFTIPGKVYGSAAFALTAPTSTSSGAWSYSSGNTNVATVSGTVTIKGVGTAVITATQAASGNYSGASTNANFVVSKAAQTITFTLPATNTFTSNGLIPLKGVDSANLPITYTSGNNSILTISGTNAVMKAKGTTTVTASQSGNGNYNAATNVVRTITLK